MTDLFGTAQYDGLVRSADLSRCGAYRWSLSREWQHGGNGKLLCFIMLNPSTADGTLDDPTVRRCMGFTQALGFSWLVLIAKARDFTAEFDEQEQGDKYQRLHRAAEWHDAAAKLYGRMGK